MKTIDLVEGFGFACKMTKIWIIGHSDLRTLGLNCQELFPFLISTGVGLIVIRSVNSHRKDPLSGETGTFPRSRWTGPSLSVLQIVNPEVRFGFQKMLNRLWTRYGVVATGKSGLDLDFPENESPGPQGPAAASHNDAG